MNTNQKKKYRNAVLYFIHRCNNRHLDDTKLTKLLYYLDFIHYRDTGRSVTGDVYHHLNFGPTPKRVREIITSLIKENAIERKKEGDRTVRYKSNIKPSTSIFTETEKELLKKICRIFRLWSTKKIITQTHLEAPWFYSLPGERIKYRYAVDIDVI